MGIVKKVTNNSFFRLNVFKLVLAVFFAGCLAVVDAKDLSFLFLLLPMFIAVFIEFKINYKMRKYHWWLLTDIYFLHINTIILRYFEGTWADNGYPFDFLGAGFIYLVSEFIAYGIIRFFFTEEEGVKPSRLRDRIDIPWLVIGMVVLIFIAIIWFI